MRLPKKFGVTFSSFGTLLLVNLVVALGSSDSHNNSPGVIHAAAVAVAAVAPTEIHPNYKANETAVPAVATEVHFEHLETRYYTGSPPTGQSHEYLNDEDHYDSYHHQQDGTHFGASASSLISRDNCKIPEAWRGGWFQSGVMSPVLIDSKSLGDKGTCIERSGDKFLFMEKSEKQGDCYKCVVINQRHPNVLQYKESNFCEKQDKLENLCSQIPGDALLYSLFRIDGEAEECPFKTAPFTFTYNRGHGQCRNPVSYIDTCTEPSRLRLRYQACPDVGKTESIDEELQCLADWKEGSHHYLVGKLKRDRTIPSNEEAYRCFMYEKVKDGHTGYNVAISGDATCTGITSPTEGEIRLVLTKVDRPEIKCKFPSWLSSHHWHTLDGKMSAKMHHKNSTMHITEDNRKNSSGHYSGGLSSGGTFSTTSLSYGTGPLFTGGSRIVCQNRKDISDRHVAIVAHHTEGCKSETICMHIYKRAKHVTEVQMLRRSDHGGSDDFDCMKPDALGPKLPYVTLVNPDSKSHLCPNLGKYVSSGVSQDGRSVRDSCGLAGGQGAFHSVVVGCGNRATMEFHSKCATQEPITSYECHGSWEENGTGFLIASPLSRSSTTARRFCFIYSESEEGLRVSSSSESCRRNVSPGVEGFWAFNLTVDGQCAEAVTGGSASSPKSCDLLVSITALASVMVMSFLSMSSLLVSSREDEDNRRTTTSSLTSCKSEATSSSSTSSSSSSSFTVDRIILR